MAQGMSGKQMTLDDVEQLACQVLRARLPGSRWLCNDLRITPDSNNAD